MARKDVEEYYNQITADYMEMIDTLKEMEELAAQDMINPDKIDDIKKIVEPMKQNYQRINWIMFLLNQPAKKSKKAGYIKRNTKFLKKCDNTEHEENKRIINTLNDVWTGKEEQL